MRRPCANATDMWAQWVAGWPNFLAGRPHPTLPSKSRIQNIGSRNSTSWDSTPHTYRVDTGRKVQGWALMDRGSTPPPSDEDDPIAAGTTAPTIGEDM
jgi:hypothetical protein